MLNTHRNPCEAAEGYVYQNCIYKRIIAKVGCRPYWLDYIQTDKENCSEVKKLEKFLTIFSVLRVANEGEILRDYECLKPCNYMEYKVREAFKNKRGGRCGFFASIRSYK